MAFQPAPVPTGGNPTLMAYLARMLREIADAINGDTVVRTYSAEPRNPQTGLVVYAADPWATDYLSGPGFYGYDGTSWVRL